MTDKQEPDIVERLRKYPADPTMCDDYSAAMLDAADEIERLREQMSMMAQYGKPPAQLADIGNTISSKTPEPNEENPYVLWREIHRLRTEVQGPSGFATWQDAAVAERVRRVKAEQELRAAQPAPAQEPQPVSNTDELPQRLSDEMDAIAIKHAHKMALDLECILAEYGGSWYNTAMQTLGEYRSEMNAIHERESPTFMGEPLIAAAPKGQS